jgi:Arm DNA-binding domain
MAQGGYIKRRLLGDGSVRYDVTVDLGPDPVTGKRRQRRKTFKTKREAQAGLTAWLAEINKGVVVDRPLADPSRHSRWYSSSSSGPRSSTV